MHHTGQRNYTEYRAFCRYPNIQLYASLGKAFLDIIVSSFILALPSFCLDCNATEILISHLHVAPLYALVSLVHTPEVHFWRGRGEINGLASITPFFKESSLSKSDCLPCLLYNAYFTEDDTHFTGERTINMQNIWHTHDRSVFILQLLDLTLLI